MGKHNTHWIQAPFSIMIVSADSKTGLGAVCYIDDKTKVRLRIDHTGFSGELHNHNFFELMLIFDGASDVFIENGRYLYQRGDACLINCSTRHREDYSRTFTAAYLSLSRDFLQDIGLAESMFSHGSRISRFIRDNIGEQTKQKNDYLNFSRRTEDMRATRAEKLLAQIMNELIDMCPGADLVTKGLLVRFFDALQDASEYTSAYIRLDSITERTLVSDAIQYIEEKKGRVTRYELGEELHYNGDYIDQVFIKHTGCSLHEYSVNLCLREAKRLLIDTELSVSEIIKGLGYENRTCFYRLFQSHCGMTPLQYRVNHRSKKPALRDGLSS